MDKEIRLAEIIRKNLILLCGKGRIWIRFGGSSKFCNSDDIKKLTIKELLNKKLLDDLTDENIDLFIKILEEKKNKIINMNKEKYKYETLSFELRDSKLDKHKKLIELLNIQYADGWKYLEHFEVSGGSVFVVSFEKLDY